MAKGNSGRAAPNVRGERRYDVVLLLRSTAGVTRVTQGLVASVAIAQGRRWVAQGAPGAIREAEVWLNAEDLVWDSLVEACQSPARPVYSGPRAPGRFRFEGEDEQGRPVWRLLGA